VCEAGARLEEVAAAWGVRVVPGQDAAVTEAAIVTAWRREVEAEERRVMARRVGK
jgi:hypothetical protein